MLENTNQTDTQASAAQPTPVRAATTLPRADIPARPEREEPHAAATIIAADMVFNGDLTSGDSVEIHGTVEGKIGRDIKSVTVGRHGRVKATIYAAKVTIEGRVEGDIHGDKLVELKSGAVVLGNVYCPTIQVDKGANFNGTVTMV